MGQAAIVAGRHAATRAGVERPVAELLDLANTHGWDTSLLSVHARRHRPYVKIPTPGRWTWTGNLFDGGAERDR